MKIGTMDGNSGSVMLPGYKLALVTLTPNQRTDGSFEYVMTTEDNTPVGWFLRMGDGFKGSVNGQNVQIIAGRNGSGIYTL